MQPVALRRPTHSYKFNGFRLRIRGFGEVELQAPGLRSLVYY